MAMMNESMMLGVAVFVVVAALVGAVGFFLLESFSPERRRLEALATRRQARAEQPGSLEREAPAGKNSITRFVPKSPKEMGRLRRQLAMGGFHSPAAVAAYALAEVLLPVVFALTSLVVLGTSQVVLALLAAVLGYLIPSVFLGRIVKGFKKEIRNGLPDALDLMIVCVEAGSGLDQALVKTADELAVSYPRLAGELSMITTEIRAGKPRLEAFKNFAERTKVDDVQSLVSMLVQTDRFGTSIAQALRTHAETLRTKRRQRAEEKAAKLGVKLVFPLVLCLFPALYIVTLGPAVLKVIRVLGPALNE